MKKTLIAVAALAATSAFAQATITGTFDATVRSLSHNVNGGNSVSRMVLGQNGSGTSNVTVKTSEDLGGGMTAMALYELDFDPTQTGTNPAAGEIYVGLAGGFGSIKLGVPNLPTLTVQASRTPFGTKDGGRSAPISSVTGTSITRVSNSAVYNTPNMSGFSIGLGYLPETKDAVTGNTTDGSMTDIGLFYSAGPIAAGVAMNTISGVAGANDQKMTNYYFSYDLGMAKLTLGGHMEDHGVGANENSGLGLGVAAPLSAALTVQFSYQMLDDKRVADRDSKMLGLGVNYALSKRTSTYVRYVNQTVDNTVGGEKDSATTMLIGVRHNF